MKFYLVLTVVLSLVGCKIVIDDSQFTDNSTNNNGFTYDPLSQKLYEATILNDIDSVKSILKKGGDPNYVPYGEEGYTPFLKTCESGRDELVKAMIYYGAELNPSQSDFHINNPLALAAVNGYDLTVQILIDSGATIDGLNAYDQTNLWLAIDHEQYNTARILVESGAYIHYYNSFGNSPFDKACILGNYSFVEELIEFHNADINSTDPLLGSSAIMKTAEVGHHQIFRLLYENGARLDPSDA